MNRVTLTAAGYVARTGLWFILAPGAEVVGRWEPITTGETWAAHSICEPATIRTRGPLLAYACQPHDHPWPRITYRIHSPADWTRDGRTDTADLIAFLADFRAGTDEVAAYDGVPGVSVGDLLAFLGVFREVAG